MIASALLALSAQADVSQYTQEWSWSANAGWIKWRTADADGAKFNHKILSGYIYSANVGWISLGNGAPANGFQYANTSGADFGVNVDATSDPDGYLLSGLAYGANIGWINFDIQPQVGDQNRPRIDKRTGRLKGYIYSANLGWLPINSWEYAVVDTHMRDAATHWSLYQ